MTQPGVDRLRALESQLARMRGMDARYHDRFFRDVQFTTTAVVALLAVSLVTDEPRLLLILPFVALMGACQTAFDASYLVFARRLAAAVERRINHLLGDEVLIAHRLEDVYLFPLGRPRIVTLAGGDGFTWFGFMTAFYTVLGMGAYAVGLVGGLPSLASSAVPLYLLSLLGPTLFALIVGIWWFVAGRGEQRLAGILDPWSVAG